MTDRAMQPGELNHLLRVLVAEALHSGLHPSHVDNQLEDVLGDLLGAMETETMDEDGYIQPAEIRRIRHPSDNFDRDEVADFREHLQGRLTDSDKDAGLTISEAEDVYESLNEPGQDRDVHMCRFIAETGTDEHTFEYIEERLSKLDE